MAHAQREQRRRCWILVISLVGVFFAYVASFVGVVGSNDGSHYALTYCMFELGTFRVDSLHWPVEDVATDRFPFPVPEEGEDQIPRLPGEHFYSNKPPGTAVLAIPFYGLGRLLEPWLERYPPPATGLGRGRFPHDWFRMEVPFFSVARQVGYAAQLQRDEALAKLRQSYLDEWHRQNCVNLLPALLGVLCTWLLYRLCRHVGTGFWPALVTALLAALGTIQWRYATALFSHMPTTTFLLVLVDGLAAGWAWRRRTAAALWGLSVGCLIAVQYQAALFVPLLTGYWWWRGRESAGHRRPARGALVALGAVGPVVLLAVYQWSCFGNPLVNPVSRSRYFPYASSLREMLSGSPKEAAVSLLIQDPKAPEIGAPVQRQRRGDAARVRPAAVVQFPLLAEPTGWHATEAWRREWIDLLVGPAKRRERGYLQGAGLLMTSPFLAVAALGWLFFGSRAGRPAGLIAAMMLAQVTFIAFVRAPTGGATYDARYLTSVIPLLAVGFALSADRVARLGKNSITGMPGQERSQPPASAGAQTERRAVPPLARTAWACVRWLLYAALVLLAVLSVTNMIHSMAVFQRHEIGLHVQGRLWIDWSTRLAACFQSAGNGPLLLVAVVFVTCVAVAIRLTIVARSSTSGA